MSPSCDRRSARGSGVGLHHSPLSARTSLRQTYLQPIIQRWQSGAGQASTQTGDRVSRQGIVLEGATRNRTGVHGFAGRCQLFVINSLRNRTTPFATPGHFTFRNVPGLCWITPDFDDHSQRNVSTLLDDSVEHHKLGGSVATLHPAAAGRRFRDQDVRRNAQVPV